MQTVEVEILGKKYYFKSDNPEELLNRARILEKELEELNSRVNIVDQSKILVLYSLKILDQYLQEKDKNKHLSVEVEKINELMQNLDLEI